MGAVLVLKAINLNRAALGHPCHRQVAPNAWPSQKSQYFANSSRGNTSLGLLEEAAELSSAKSYEPNRGRPMAMLVVSTDAGDIAIQEHEVSTITAGELCQLRISRADLRRLFAEAAKLLQEIKPRDRARPLAIRALDGHWEVHTDSHHETVALEA
jgi:hypothetical protein